MDKNKFYFILVLIGTWPLRYLPFPMIHLLGKGLGILVYYFFPKFRKRALSNLALASSLALSNQEIRRIAKGSIQNLLTTCLEYPKFASGKKIKSIMSCVNPGPAEALLKQGQSVIFFCGHQANWEVLFLEGSQRMQGVAIGRPIKNKPLYNWVLQIREQFGGKIITPQNAIREGLRALKKGLFLGVVGDQGMPDSGYRSPFFGREAWSSPIAAILSHRTGSPLIVATTKREKGRYLIHYADPIWPQTQAPLAEEVDRLMRASLHLLEESIRESPEEWLWCHNRWKQQTPHKLKKPFRHESILIVLSEETPLELVENLSIFRTIYPYEFITVYTPTVLLEQTRLEGAEILAYSDSRELFKEDFRFKLLFNFTPIRTLNSHFKKLAVFTAVSLEDLQLDRHGEMSLCEQLKNRVLKSDAS